ncbi:MAG: hypothetical protein ACFFDI_07025 [Promethearchaeota archaeon]
MEILHGRKCSLVCCSQTIKLFEETVQIA